MKKNLIIVLAVLTLFLAGCNNSTQTQNKAQNKTNKNTETTATTKKDIEKTKEWKDEMFSFNYPAKYVSQEHGIGSLGLFTEAEYRKFINPPKDCLECNMPHYEVYIVENNSSLKDVIKSYFLFPVKKDKDLEEKLEKDGKIKYENLTIGDNDFIKVKFADKLFNKTAYFTESGKLKLGFIVYFEKNDDADLQQILKSLKFNKTNKRRVVGAYNYSLDTKEKFKKDKVCFEPAQFERVGEFCFKDTEKVLKTLNIKKEDNCKNYNGTVDLEIKNLTNKDNVATSKQDKCLEDNSCEYNEAELVKVNNVSDQTCN